MGATIRPPDDVYWHFRRLRLHQQVGAECTSKEDGCLYRVRHDRVICRVVEGIEQETIDSIPFKLPTGAKVMTGVGWGFRMPIATFTNRLSALRAQSGENKARAQAGEAVFEAARGICSFSN